MRVGARGHLRGSGNNPETLMGASGLGVQGGCQGGSEEGWGVKIGRRKVGRLSDEVPDVRETAVLDRWAVGAGTPGLRESQCPPGRDTVWLELQG